MDRAILSRDANEFAAVFADDPVVNNPFTGSRARKTRSGIL
jgi:hypothetical protein